MQTTILNGVKTAPELPSMRPLRTSIKRTIDRSMSDLFGPEFSQLSTSSKIKGLYPCLSFFSLSAACNEEMIWLNLLLVANFALAACLAQSIFPKRKKTTMKSQPITITIQVADQWSTSTITAKTNYEMSSFEADPDDSYSSASAKLSINLFDYNSSAKDSQNGHRMAYRHR